MNEREVFEKTFERPSNYFELSRERQLEIDKNLGILGWSGLGLVHFHELRLSKQDKERFLTHYKK